MAIFDIFKRLVNAETDTGDRRTDERLRATQGARVLIVDDSATIRAVLGKMLLQDGYMVLRAVDGESAIELAHSYVPDLIFLDIVLPGMSGFAVLRALRHDSRTRTTPIVMMSGNQQATEQFYVQRFGADGFVKKPFGRTEVFHAVRSLVQAGRTPARVVAPAPPAEIPAGMSPEEWAAIPDIAMPDAEHLVAGCAAPASSPPSLAAVDIRPGRAATLGRAASHAEAPARTPETAHPSFAGRAETVIAGTATSMAIRPTWVADAPAAPGPKIAVQVERPREPGADPVAIANEAPIERAGGSSRD